MSQRASENRLRIVHVTWGLEMGGQEKLLVEFARHTDRSRFDLRFVSLGSGGALAGAIEECGWPIVHLDSPAKFQPGLILRLAGHFRRWRTDVVHTHENRPLLHGAPAARLAGAATVHTRHGNPEVTRRQARFIGLVARLTHRFVCVSHDSARRTIQGGVGPAKVVTIWNGVDLARFAATGAAPNGPAVCVARLSPEKGIDVLLRAAALVIREDPRFRLQIAGDGACRTALGGLLDQLNLRDRVDFLGQVNDVEELLTRASLFVLPSLSEGIPLTILEAMARGLPVLATRVGGNAEVVTDGETGLLVPAGDPNQLAAGILRLRRDPDRSRVMGRNGRWRAEQFFDLRHMIAVYEDLYQEAAAPRCRN